MLKDRYQRLRLIEKLDPETDYHQIFVLDLLYEFPWDIDISQWLAFYNTITPPDDATFLVRTGDMLCDTQRRLDHMATLMWEMNRNGFDHPSGQAAVRRMNRIHKSSVKHLNATGERWDITNEQYLFVLATTLVTPQRWLDRYGWRPVAEQERLAAVLFYRDFGRHMGLKDIPQTWAEFVRFHDDYESRHVVHTAEAAQLWQATRGRLVERLTFWLPSGARRWFEPVALRMLPVLLSGAQRRAFGIAQPSAAWRTAVHLGLKARALYVRLSDARIVPAAPDKLPTRTFPTADYEITEIGPGAAPPRENPPQPPRESDAASWPGEQLGALPRAEREHRLVEIIRTEVAAVLGRSGRTTVPRAQPFTDLGLDSMAVVRVRDALVGATGLKLPATLLFDYPTPEALARHLAERIPSAAPAGDEVDQRVREALATLPVYRLREAGLLAPLLGLAGHAELADTVAGTEARAGSSGGGDTPDQPATEADPAIDTLGTDDLIRMALEKTDS